MVRGRALDRELGSGQRGPSRRDRGTALTARVERLLPERGETTVADQVATLDLVPLAPPDRPYLITNFALTLDGHATIAGRSGPIGTATDTALLVGLRTRVEAVMIGAGTMRAERYGRVIADPAKRERREREGLPADPLVVIVSGRLDLPWDAPLFTEGVGRCLICTSSEVDPPETPTAVEVLRQEGGVDLRALLEHLRRELGVRALLCEGGPRLHGQLLDAGVVDELFVTHAPKLAGGAGPGLVVGLSELERPLELAWLLADDTSGELFGRYRVPRG
jgi:riboflavin-specific deaminase-like protein